MTLVASAHKILSELEKFTSSIPEEKYCYKIPQLSQGSIGQHIRHVVEFFQCLLQGAEQGIINYDKRLRNKELEQNPEKAVVELKKIIMALRGKNLSQELRMEFNCDSEEEISNDNVTTNFGRELLYNIEHAVHHMAIVKIGFSILEPVKKLPENFGVAASTIRYQKEHVHTDLSS